MQKLPSLLKPSLKTKFHIDYDWWKSQDRNWRNALQGFLCAEHQAVFSQGEDYRDVDMVDPVTAEVTQGDALMDTLINHCAKQEGFLGASAPLVDSVFKVFLVNGNQPLTSVEISDLINKPADTILRTIGSARVYKGIRPL